MFGLLADASPFEAAHLAGMIVLGGVFVAMFGFVVWEIWTRRD